VALSALLGATTSAGSLLSQLSLPSASAQPQVVGGSTSPQPQPLPEQPLDRPLRMIMEAREQYNLVQNYQGIFISQERVNGKLQAEEATEMSFRKTPFSVYMKWLAPKDKVGQEVAYVQGRNQGQMRVLPTWPKMWMNIAVNDSRVMQHSRHTILEAGFGNLIERCGKCWEAERLLNKTQVQIAEYEYNKRRCARVEVVHTMRDPSFYCYRSVVYFDAQTKLPVRMECYDWPRQGGPPEGELLECYSYVNLQFNVNMPETMFNR
jgi:hypothetical protein